MKQSNMASVPFKLFAAIVLANCIGAEPIEGDEAMDAQFKVETEAPPYVSTVAAITRPTVEIFGSNPAYGIAGSGVNTANGNFSITVEDLGFAVNLLDWRRTYNSLDDSDGPLGRGWASALSARLVIAADGSVVLHNDDGRVLTFVPHAGGYLRPADLAADLRRDDSGRFTLRFVSGVTWTFDATGKLVELADDGERVALAYDSAGRLLSATHSAGATLSFLHAGNHIVKATSSDGRAVSYGYAADGALAEVTSVDGSVTRYEATDSGQLSAIIDADGRRLLANVYDAAGRVRHQELAARGGLDFDYDDAGFTIVSSTASGAVTGVLHDASGRLTSVIDPSGNSMAFAFDAAGQLLSLTTRGGAQYALEYDARGNLVRRDESGAVTRWSYDAQDRIESVTDAVGGVMRYAYLGNSRIPSQIIDPTGAVTHQTIEAGLVTTRTDATGATTRFTYDSGRHLIATTDALGHTTRYEYDAARRIIAVIRPLGAITRLEYDAAGRLIAQIDPMGGIARYRYSASGLLLDETDADGAVMSYRYDPAGHRVAIIDPIGRKTDYAYNAQGMLASVTNPVGTISRYTHDQHDRVSTVIAADDIVIRYAYDADDNLTERTDPAGTETSHYDSLGNLIAVTDQIGRTRRYEYDELGQEIAMIDPTGAVWRTAYDSAGRVISRTDPLGNVTRYEYDAAGRLSATIDPLGHVMRYFYDGIGRLIRVIDPAGGVSSYEYDADGRRISSTTPAGLVTRYEYDANNRLIKVINPRGGITRYEYSARGQRTASISPGGAVRRWQYDASGQMVSQTDPNGAITRYDYDNTGNLISLTDAKGAITRYSYDALGRQTSTTDPLGRMTRQVYDAVGNLVSVTDPSGVALRMEYDAAGQLLRRVAADGATISFTYDLAGRRISMTDSTGTTRYRYDAAGRRISVIQPDGSLFESTYDAARRRIALQYPDGLKVDYRYDPNDRLVGLTDPRAGDVTYTLDPDGRLLSEELPNDWSRHYRYRAGLLESYQETRHGAPSEDTVLAHDADERIISQIDHGKRIDYQYDAADQLLFASGYRGTLQLTYDAVGNRLTMRRAGVETRFNYNAADELVASDTGPHHVGYRYDGAGRLVEQTGRNERLVIRYNSFGLPAVSTHTHGGVTETREATYDGAGLLTSVVTTRSPGSPPPQTSTVHYQWTAGEGVQQILTQRGEDEANFVYGYGRVLADTPAGWALFARDVYGSTIRTAQTMAWAQAQSYDPFGEPDSAGAPPLANPRFGYRGELAFGSSVYLRSRMYDSSVGRFTARDPVTTIIGQTDTVSPYAYANNSPANFSDPLGKFSLGQIGTMLAPLYSPDPCPDPGDSIGPPHPKCFQGRPGLKTRGYIPQECLDARESCLNDLWNNRQKERAAHAVALNEQNRRREGWWQRLLDQQGFGTNVHRDVDWEVQPEMLKLDNNFRADIITNEKNLYEVKRWSASAYAEVEAQLGDYSFYLDWDYGVLVERGKEFQGWASLFRVRDSWDDYLLGGDEVYVWGLGLPRGHVYFSKSKRVFPKVKDKAREKYLEYNDFGSGILPIPFLPRVPVIP